MVTQRHLERYEWAPRGDVDGDVWPFNVPAVAQVISEGGFDVPPGITFLVGENGSGKSTLVEAFAAAYPRHGAESASDLRVTGPKLSDEDSLLHWGIRRTTWDELDVVANWRDFLAAPGRWLRHVVDPEA